ncbi:hypothetical protein GCM10027341_10280 [Spirosoma knui]
MDLIERNFDTPLGLVRCGFKSTKAQFLETRAYENGESEIFNSLAYRIEVVTFKIRQPLYNGETVSDSNGWLLRIEKIADGAEEIESFCELEVKNGDVDFDTATGESLDAIEAFNKDWILHIGTEDGEILRSRAELDDWFPPRLRDKVDFSVSITQMKRNGFITHLPDLKVGEKISIHYLTAYDIRNESKVNTWLAVEESKRALENWIGLW